MSRPTKPLPFIDNRIKADFLLRVDRRGPDECWPWMGPTNQRGYGQFALCRGSDRQLLTAHRLAWVIETKQSPDEMHVLHRCDNPPCCNPAHLFLGTHQDNMADMQAKGRRVAGKQKRGAVHHKARYSQEMRDQAVALHFLGDNYSYLEIAKHVGCGRVTVSRWIEEVEIAAGWRLEKSKTYLRSRPSERPR